MKQGDKTFSNSLWDLSEIKATPQGEKKGSNLSTR